MSKYCDVSDVDLCISLKNGDESAFTEIYNRYSKKVYQSAYKRLTDRMEAEEIMQEVFLSLWKRRDILDIKYSILTYLNVAVKYKVINYQSRNLSKGLKLDTHLNEQTLIENSTELWFNEKELRSELIKNIEKLPEKCRNVFKMSRDQYHNNSEIAKKLGLSEKTIEAHITRALGFLKTLL
jgi:RNA polymerase sigma-70 factor (family 1)